MAKISIEFDSESKTLSVSIGGQQLENVKYVSISDYESCCDGKTRNVSCVVETASKEDPSLRVRTTYYSDYTLEAQASLRSGNNPITIDGFVGVSEVVKTTQKLELEEAIHKFLGL